MAKLQPYFIDFHKTIRLSFEDSAVLREKRDIVLRKLKTNLKKNFEDRGETPPTFKNFDQGSYAMGTGTKPLVGDYDIDVAIVFSVAADAYPDPVEVKKWVHDALDGHTRSVKVRQPCVTVFYQADDAPIYHVDLAIYSSSDYNDDGKTYLARGRLGSSEENRVWEINDPKELKRLITERFSGEDRKQFRRIVRYLKRWRNVKFSSAGNASPLGIGMTVAAYKWFVPNRTHDIFAADAKYHDHEALLDFVNTMLANFRSVDRDGEVVERLEVELPVEPYNDLFAKMTDQQMATFKERLTALRDALDEALRMADPVEACKLLRKYFGEDFPVPEKEETAEVRNKAYSYSSSSG